METMRVDGTALERFTGQVFAAAGAPSDIADIVGRLLVDSDRKGHLSHGLSLLLHYVNGIQAGHIHADARPSVLQEAASAVVVDGGHGLGHYTAEWCMDLAIGKARETGACCVSMVNCGHVGRLGAYSEQAAAAGMIGFVTSGLGGPGMHEAAPYGAAAPALSTNPISFSAPTEADDPFMADFATTTIANSKVHLYRMIGRKLPPGTAVDKDGAPTDDPAAAIDGGHLLTFGRHKGFALSLFTALLGGLTGEADPEKGTMRGQFLMALDPGAFGDADAYRAGVQAFLDGMRSTPPADGFDEVLVAGDLEARTRQRQEAEGIELPEGVWERLAECSERFGIPLPDVRAS